MRAISMERVEQTRQEILDIIESPILTHEQKVANMAGKADSLMEVLDLPEGLVADVPHHPVGDPVVNQAHHPLGQGCQADHHADAP